MLLSSDIGSGNKKTYKATVSIHPVGLVGYQRDAWAGSDRWRPKGRCSISVWRRAGTVELVPVDAGMALPLETSVGRPADYPSQL
jgi:hypothetical protein